MSGPTLLTSLVVAQTSGPSNKYLDLPKPQSNLEDMFKQINRGRCEWVVFELTPDESEICVKDFSSPNQDSYEMFLDTLIHDQQPRWGLVNIRYRTVDGGKRCKTTFVAWIPDSLQREKTRETVRVKMQAVASTGLLKKIFTGYSCFVEANSREDLQHSEVLRRASKHEVDQIA
jgi:hypothetical protein